MFIFEILPRKLYASIKILYPYFVAFVCLETLNNNLQDCAIGAIIVLRFMDSMLYACKFSCFQRKRYFCYCIAI